MPSFSDLSISKKMVAVTMLATALALTMASIAFLAIEWFAYRKTMVTELNSTAQMIGASSTAALTFGDRSAASETLAALRGEKRVEEACIFARAGAPFACYSRDAKAMGIEASLRPAGSTFTTSHVTLYVPIILGQEQIGTVYLKCGLAELYQRIRGYVLAAGVVLLISLGAALLASSKLQRIISRPVLELADTASRVSAEKNYSIRARSFARDEVGLLVERFNEMMEQIHSRDLALQSARDDLEQRVDERTAQLQFEIAERKAIEKDLIAAKEAAEQSDRAKSAFLANMSHELRTPLNAIIGYSEMIEEDADDVEAIVPDAQKIQSAGKHLLALINDILDISKIEAGRLELRPEPVLIGALLNEVVHLAEPLARRNGNRFQVTSEFSSEVIETDLIRFRQSIINLVSNACKFTENGQVSLDVERFETEDGRKWYDFRVHDTGIGISPDQRFKLFQSFSQIDSSSTRKHGGTGLGLAISKRLCEMMGGQILVESELAVGSTFTLRLPSELRAGEGAMVVPLQRKVPCPES